VDIVFALIAFFALVATWFVLPAAPRTAKLETAQQTTHAETLAPAA
jgi:hypothetical protein